MSLAVGRDRSWALVGERPAQKQSSSLFLRTFGVQREAVAGGRVRTGKENPHTHTPMQNWPPKSTRFRNVALPSLTVRQQITGALRQEGQTRSPPGLGQPGPRRPPAL